MHGTHPRSIAAESAVSGFARSLAHPAERAHGRAPEAASGPFPHTRRARR